MESQQLARGRSDLLLYQNFSLLNVPPYDLRYIKIKESKVPTLGALGTLPTFWHVGQSKREKCSSFGVGSAGLGCKPVGAGNSVFLQEEISACPVGISGHKDFSLKIKVTGRKTRVTRSKKNE